ncbi:MAG: hypothetical protein WD688_09700 [Candidatus Binatia bacterium]
MADQIVYALLLRPVGQLLEALRIESFALLFENEDLVVRDQTPGRKQITPREKALLAEWQVTHTRPQDKEGALKLATGILEWRMTSQDIDRFEREGQSRRRNPNRTPDIHSISQMLRVVGALVDHKSGRLLTINKDDQKVTFEYELLNGKKVSEELGVPALYDLWVRIYRKQTSK